MNKRTNQIVLLILTIFVYCNYGCEVKSHRVLVVTGTSIGIAIAQNPQTQLYEAKLGYDRGEFGLVPTNRPMADDNWDGTSRIRGADESVEVLMEISQTGIFSAGNGGIYQRLAVGKIAVQQPGAQLMMAKGPNGELPAEVTAYLDQVSTPARSATAEVKRKVDSIIGGPNDARFRTLADKSWEELSAAEIDELKSFTGFGGHYDKSVHEMIRSDVKARH